MFFKNYKNVSVNSNTVRVNGRTIHLPSNYSSLSVIGDVVYVDGVRYDGDSIEEVKSKKKDMKKIEFNEIITSISADVANINVKIVDNEQSNILYDNNEYEVNISDGFVIIENKTKSATSDIDMVLNKKYLYGMLNLNVEKAGSINFKTPQEELDVYLTLKTKNGDIKISGDFTKDVILNSGNGDIKSLLDCRKVDIKTSNGDIKGDITVKEDSTVKTGNGDVKLCTSSKIIYKVKHGDVKIKNDITNKSTINVSVSNGDLKIG